MKKGKPAKRKPASGKQRGAQPGNKNAMTHGFYIARFTPNEKQRLDVQDATDVQAEIALLRVCIDRLTGQLDLDPIYMKDKKGTDTDIRDDHYLKALNTLSIMTQSLGTLARTHHLVHGKAGSVQDSILLALEELRLEMGL